MREIKFRGMSKEHPCFVYGYLYKGDTGDSYIIEYKGSVGDEVEVHSDTVGQFTGHKDSNGVEIFEGDRLKLIRDDADVEIVYCRWGIGYPAFDLYVKTERTASGYESYCEEYNSFTLDDFNLEVIGNIHV